MRLKNFVKLTIKGYKKLLKEKVRESEESVKVIQPIQFPQPFVQQKAPMEVKEEEEEIEGIELPKRISKRVKLVNSRCSFIPKDTISSISCGTKEGFSLMVNSFVDKYKRKLEIKQNMRNTKVIVTGGESYVLRNKFNFSYIYDPLLTLKGLLLLKEFI